MKLEKLTFLEKVKLEGYKKKITNLIVSWGGGSFILFLFISIIPMGLIPNKRRVVLSNPDMSIFESMGVFQTILIMSVISGIITLYLLYTYKYLKILKDLVDLKKVTLNVVIMNVIPKKGQGPKEVEVYFKPAYKNVNRIEFIGYDNLPLLYKKQEVELVIAPNSYYPLSVKSKEPVKDVLHSLEVLNKYKQRG
ncbi:hypothetical protein CXF68_13390 [Tenacibaculum sp. Bg11-29]|uniref:hypothetical protein n=1 Tax=Tenacibaculum sp. Bg11-29 TaxID=2058306 RepID=UPI000C33F92F|nr:hypothetical protein [Tenacibaculum sp. Bg11-29]PKH51614.1 hypothetical protein CXF68_13390 [Tenacibaculum sp. Bg11-29]